MQSNFDQFTFETFSKVSALEDELCSIEQMEREEEAKIQHKYDLLKAPIYQKRNEVVSKIPSFWRMALMNHGMLNTVISEEDVELLDKLQCIEVNRDPEDVRVFIITAKFGPNDAFENTEIKRELRSNPDGSIMVKDTPINWKSKSGDKRKRELSFLSLFADESEDTIELVNVFITDFYPNVISYYQGEADDDDDDDDDDEDLEDVLESDQEEK